MIFKNIERKLVYSILFHSTLTLMKFYDQNGSPYFCGKYVFDYLVLGNVWSTRNSIRPAEAAKIAFDDMHGQF